MSKESASSGRRDVIAHTGAPEGLPLSSPELVWHYTSLNTLPKILAGASLRATEVRFQNDPMEFNLVKSMLLERLSAYASSGRAQEELEGALNVIHLVENQNALRNARSVNHKSNRFVACASTFDNFYAWRTYGSVGEVGCAIAFHVSDSFTLRGGNPLRPPVQWTPVRYDGLDDDVVLEIVEGLVQCAIDNPQSVGGVEGSLNPYLELLRDLENYVSTHHKHPSYEGEQESRLTIADGVQYSDLHSIVQYADGAMGPRPYVELEWAASGDHLPVAAVMLGPTATEQSFYAARYVLEDYGAMGEVLVARSRHPYRTP